VLTLIESSFCLVCYCGQVKAGSNLVLNNVVEPSTLGGIRVLVRLLLWTLEYAHFPISYTFLVCVCVCVCMCVCSPRACLMSSL
jgi:hypothetical protein